MQGTSTTLLGKPRVWLGPPLRGACLEPGRWLGRYLLSRTRRKGTRVKKTIIKMYVFVCLLVYLFIPIPDIV